MTVVVDANILFSCILGADGAVGKTWFDARQVFKFVAPEYLRQELTRLRPRMVQQSKLPAGVVQQSMEMLLSHVVLINEEVIPSKLRTEAAKLAARVDKDDIPYVALALYFKCPIWSGDKKLRDGLAAGGFQDMLSTAELRHLLAG